VPWLEAGVGVMPEDLEAAEKAAGVAPLRLAGVTGSPVNPIGAF
jgi:hypothetical protein